MKFRFLAGLLTALVLVLFLSSSAARAYSGPTWEVLAKASPDECFKGVGDPENQYPFDPEENRCRGKLKRNEAYVWGLTQFGGNIFFGTGPNIHCLVLQGYLGQNDPVLTDEYVCEGSANDPQGDMRPPSLYMYNDAQGLVELTLPPIQQNGPSPQMLRQFTLGIRSAGQKNGVVFLAGPGINPETGIQGVNMFAFDGRDGSFIAATAFEAFDNVRKWLLASDGNLYVGVGGSESGTGNGSVLQWNGDAEAILNGALDSLFDFESVGTGLDGEAAELAEHNGKLFIATWPLRGEQLQAAGLWMSPELPLETADQDQWTKVWSAAQYDPDPVTAITYGGGALASYDGWVFWGTMHVPGTSAAAHSRVYGEPETSNAQTEMLTNTHRAISIFKGKNFGTDQEEIQLLYGGSPANVPIGYFPAYNPVSERWQIRQNLMGLSPKYGRGGFNNQYNNYCWTMQVYHGYLFVGTMDFSFLLDDYLDGIDSFQDYLIRQELLQIFGSYEYGADVYHFISSESPAKKISLTGMGNPMNYGIRTMIADSDHLHLGTANPMNLDRRGGWELIRLETGRIRTPEVTGLSQEAALVKMSSAGLVEGNINYKCTDLVAPGFVFRQSPGAGQIVSSNSQYELTIAAADCPTVPDCMGMSLQEARTEIENAGLIADAPTYECSEAPTDDIIEQSPEPGTLVAAGTTIYLVASSGPCPIVPDCVGDDQATAESKIADAGLRTGNISNECHDTIPEGKIISQDPAAGTIAENNDPVDLVLSSGACAPEAPSVGDIDGDGQVCSKDLNLLLGSMWRFVSWNDPRNIDGDGFITYRDYIIIQRYCTYPGCECR